MEDEAVLSIRRPLCVQRSTERPESPPKEASGSGNPGMPSTRRREFYNEEIEHHAHVTVEKAKTFCDVICDVNWPTFFYFAFLVTASMFVSLGMEAPTLWMITAVAALSIGLFVYLKL